MDNHEFEHYQVHKAIRDGLFKRPTKCERCGKKVEWIVAHHPIYSKPLKVMWLCGKCHTAVHRTAKLKKTTRTTDEKRIRVLEIQRRRDNRRLLKIKSEVVVMYHIVKQIKPLKLRNYKKVKKVNNK